MDAFLKHRALDKRYGSRFDFVSSTAVSNSFEPLQRRARTPTPVFKNKLIVSTSKASVSQGPCWEGYHRDYSKEKYTSGSCVPNKNSADKPKKRRSKKRRPKASGSGSETDTQASSSEGEGGKKKEKAKKAKDEK